jgi:hypothetical protein
MCRAACRPDSAAISAVSAACTGWSPRAGGSRSARPGRARPRNRGTPCRRRSRRRRPPPAHRSRPRRRAAPARRTAATRTPTRNCLTGDGRAVPRRARRRGSR